MRPIPSRDEYYFDGECFKIKSSFLKKFRIGLLVGLAVGFISFTSNDDAAMAAISERLTLESAAPTKEIALIDFVSKYNKQDAANIVKSAFKWSEHFNVDPITLLAIAFTESHFDTHAISSAGAMGVMQILTRWHVDKIVEAKKVIGDPSPFNVNTNMFLGAWVFKECQQKNKSIESQLHCYNGAVSKESTYDDKVLTNLKMLEKV